MEKNSKNNNNKGLGLRFAQARIMLNFRTNVLKMEPEEAIHDVDMAFQRANMSGDARHLVGENLLRYLAKKRNDGSNQSDNNEN